MQLFTQSLVLIASFVFIFIWENTLLAQFTVSLLGLIIAMYLIISSRRKGKGFISIGGGPWGVFLLNTLILLLIFSTGSINSPLFFLLYFLVFGIAFVFDPSVIFVFAIGTILIFMPEVLKTDITNNFLKVGSILLISPLAFFFGNEYRRNDKQSESIEELKERTSEAADTISKDVEGVLNDEKQNMKPKDMDKLNEVLEETEDLRQEAKE
jgi:hypothetical protein